MQIEELVAKKLEERKGLRRRFFLTVVLPPLIPLTILGILGSLALSGIIRNSLLDQLERGAAATAARADREFSIRETILRKISDEIYDIAAKKQSCLNKINQAFPNRPLGITEGPESGIIDSPECEPFLSEFARQQSALRQVYTRYGSGSFTSPTLPTAASNEFNRIYSTAVTVEFERKAQEKFGTFSGFFPETNQIAVIQEKAAVSEYKKKEGALLITKDDYGKEEGVRLARKVDKNFALVSHKILGDKERSVLALYGMEFLQPTIEAAPRANDEDNIIVLDGSGVPAISLQKEQSGALITKDSPIENAGWSVRVSSPSELVLAPLRRAQILSALAILISLLVSLVVGFFFVSSATKAIRRLLTGAITFAQGKFDQKIYLASGDELETLAETMNEMAKQIKEAQNALVEKSKEFIYVATHELKAPLTAIIGYLSMIVDDGIGKIDKQAREFITQAYSSTVQLRELVGDLLDIARLEAEKEQFTIAPIDIAGAVKDAVEMQAITAKGRGITMSYLPPADLPRVGADKDKLRIILTNFISNAIKYNKDRGTVSVTHQIEDGYLITSVADTGLGIPKEQSSMMFNKFFRVKGKDRQSIQGTGLGLYVTKQYIEKMGGRIWFDSEAGRGTTFHFALPIYKK